MSDFKDKMHQIILRRDPDPAGEACSTPPDLLAGFNGPTSKERAGKGKVPSTLFADLHPWLPRVQLLVSVYNGWLH